MSESTIGLANAVELLLAAVDEDWPTVNAILHQAGPDLLLQLLWLSVQLANEVGMDDAKRDQLRAKLHEADEQDDGGQG